ncbi:MAG: TIGR04283 family arsenosugar biosynthesis glycosyltransferase [Leptolyngbyaceae cyanobacterium]
MPDSLLTPSTCRPHCSTSHYRLIIFTRYPIPGATKTRLIPALGPEGAANIQCSMTEWTTQTATELHKSFRSQPYPLRVEIRFTGSNMDQMQEWLGDEWLYCEQGGGDLGQRLTTAFENAFEQGAIAALAIGIDCPGITVDLLAQAYDKLNKHDVVIGPADDGGYYLIGLRQLLPELFESILWGTEIVRDSTLAIARKLNLAIAQLPTLSDIDRPEDLVIWQQLSQQNNTHTPGQISIIIPTLNEASHIVETLQPLQDASAGTDIDIIVVDGGSTDATLTKVTEAIDLKARVLTSTVGRANQMNAGAAIATGEYLLFLHADTLLPPNFPDQVQAILVDPHNIAGAFELSIQGTDPRLRWIEWGIKWRSHLFQMPYGDQAIFLRASTFREMGGFPRIPIMEDYELICRLKKLGTVAIASHAATTSARRWQKLGLWQTTVLNQLIILGYKLGIPPSTLIKWYGRKN